jgi:hypothetical protein
MTPWRGGARVLLLAADRALLFLGEGRGLRHAYEFTAGEDGWASFANYLASAPPTPLYVLVDVVEEEYRQDTIPHVSGADRRSVLARKFARLFRGTPYCLALKQGREREGRRDDRVLLTALTKPEAITPWIAEIMNCRIPLAGIFSLPVLSVGLLQKVKATASNVLIISVQQVSGLRQTFYRDGQLKISRLAQMPRLGSVPYATYVLAELAKLRRYLNSLALVSRESPLAIYVLSHGSLLEELEQHCRHSESEQYFLVDNADLAQRIGLPASVASPYSDAIFAQLLLNATPPTHYAQRHETRFYFLHQAKLGLLAASLLLLVGSAGWSALRFLDAVSLKQQALDAAQKSAFYRERFALARRGLPPTAVDATAIERAVTVAKTLEELKASPLPAWQLLGAVFADLPAVTVDKLSWYRTFDPNRNPAVPQETPPAATIALAPEYFYYAVTDIEAHLADFDGDYRAAIATIEALATRLRAAPHVHAVEIKHYPLDLRSAASVAGSASATVTDAPAAFTMRVILGVTHVRQEG